LNKFYFLLLAWVLIIGLAMEFGIDDLWWKRPSFGWEIIGIVALITSLVFFRLNKTHQNQFVLHYLLSLVLKLLMGGVLVGVTFWLDKKAANENAVLFLVTYLVFTCVEVFFLYSKINGGTSKNKLQ
jgi:hypothetical protein